ncbi:FAD-dependent monooxygenase [Nonomuraea sp. NPDC059023]|uniref:FAD-dependent monooxygenase n=1 Tax=unclassified Nonomuraea TaxID=2593643 RepID=UPI0036A5B3FE
MHVIVIGGGIGGLCLANGLMREGVSVAVYERDHSPTDRTQGYRIHVNTVGSMALHACLPPAVWNAFVATAGDPGEGMAFLTYHLDSLALIEADLVTGGRTAPEEGHHAVSRITLRRLLLAGLGDAVQFGKQFVGYDVKDDGRVLARFSDGSTAEGDVLVGADGANSRVRRQRLPQAERVDSGAVAVGGKFYLTPESRQWLPERVPAGMNIIFGPPRHAMFTAVFNRRMRADQALESLGEQLREIGLDPETFLRDASDSDYVLWAMVAHRDAYPAGAAALDGGGLRAMVERMIGGWHPGLLRMVGESRPGDIELFDFKTSTPVKPWPSSTVTLLGDAIHSMLPTGGEGGNTAMRDAQLLTTRLSAAARGEQPLLETIAAYERQMCEYGFAATKKALANAKMGISASRTQRVFARTFFRVCQAVPPLKRRIFSERWAEPEEHRPL